jgi:hypothetical protein
MQQFLEIFTELRWKNFYLTGESVRVVCYIANFFNFLSVCRILCAMSVASELCETHRSDWLTDIADYIYSNPNILDLKPQGIWLASRMSGPHFCHSTTLMTNLAFLAPNALTIQVPSVNFVHKNENVFAFKSFHLICVCELSSHTLSCQSIFSRIY